jgi:hypothetical protein
MLTRDEALQNRGEHAKPRELLWKPFSDHTALGGTMKHLTFGITLSLS